MSAAATAPSRVLPTRRRGPSRARASSSSALNSIDVRRFPTLGDQISTLLHDELDSADCVFEVEGERFPAHSLVMSARSAAFRAMLRTGAEMLEGS